MLAIQIIFIFFISIIIWLIIGKKWENIQDFFHKRYSFIELSFILFYFTEQLILTIMIYQGYNAQLMSGIFSIIIITTASLQNKCWESRTQKITETTSEQSTIIESMTEKNNKLILDNQKLKSELENSKKLIEKLFNELKKDNERLKSKKKR